MSIFSQEQLAAACGADEAEMLVSEYAKQVNALQTERKRLFEDAVQALETSRIQEIETELWEKK